jgi:uncharacterized membrane protein YfcA
MAVIIIIGIVIIFISAISLAFGIGGGAFYTPIQVAFGIEFHKATTTAMLLILTGATSAFIVYRRKKLIDYLLALILALSSACGSFLGGFYSGRFSAVSLSLLFAVIVGISGFIMFLTPEGKRSGISFSRFSLKREHGDDSYAINLPLAIPIAFFIGMSAAMIGIGGGALMVPLMALIFNVPIKVAIGSSSFIILLTALFGFGGHLAAGHFEPKLALILAACAFAGGQVGPHIITRIERKKARRYSGILLMGLAFWMGARVLI